MPSAIRRITTHGQIDRRGSRRRLALALVTLCLTLLGTLALVRQADAFIYWANNETGTIGRAELSGEAVDQGFIGGLDEPLAVAVSGDYIYWTEPTSEGEHVGTIGRAHLDGSASNPPSSAPSRSRPAWPSQTDASTGRKPTPTPSATPTSTAAKWTAKPMWREPPPG